MTIFRSACLWGSLLPTVVCVGVASVHADPLAAPPPLTASPLTVSVADAPTRPGWISGRVTDGSGKPVAGASVTARTRDGRLELAATTDDQGRFRFDGLTAGAWIVAAKLEGSLGSKPLVLAVEQGAVLEADLELARPVFDEQVVVTAEARAQPIEEVGKPLTVIDAAEITRRDEIAVIEAIRRVAGVQVRIDGGPGQLATLRFRGLRPEASAVLIDGLRFRDVSTTQGDASAWLSNLNVIAPDRLEVLRGSASSLYGTNAVGGAVNIVSRSGAADTGGELQVDAGQLGQYRVRGLVAGSVGGTLQYAVGGLHYDVTDGVDGNDPARSTGIQGRVSSRVGSRASVWGRLWGSDDEVRLNTSPSAFEVPGENLGASPIVPARPLGDEQIARLVTGEAVSFGSATYIPGIDDPDAKRSSSFVSAAGGLAVQAGNRVAVAVRAQHLHGTRGFVNGPGGPGFQPQAVSLTDFTGTADTVEVVTTFDLSPEWLVAAGYEFEREGYDGQQQERPSTPLSLQAGTRISQDAHAGLLRAGYTWRDRLSIASSARVQGFRLSRPSFEPADVVSPYAAVAIEAPPTALTGDLAVSWNWQERGTKLRAHVGNAYRAPSLYERFGGGFSSNPRTGEVSFSPYGDPMLEPERFVSVDAGIDQALADGRLRLRSTVFRTQVEQLIEFDFSGGIDPVTDPYGRFVGYIDGSGGRSQGLELEADAQVGELLLSSAYTFTDSTLDRDLTVTGFYAAFGVARHTLALTAGRRFGRFELVGDLFARSATHGAFFTLEGARALEFPSMVKLDLGAAYTWVLDGGTRLRGYAKVDNVLDHTYYELGWLAPGATFVGGMAVTF